MKLGLICRMDDTGLGNQTRELMKLLRPYKLLVINSTSFNKNEQHPEWYADYTNVIFTKAWPDNTEVAQFMDGLTHVFSAELMYNDRVYDIARQKGIKTYVHVNYEFCDQLRDRRRQSPYYWVLPSHWKKEEMDKLFRRVEILPPPLFMNEYKQNRQNNYQRSGRLRFLHIIGRQAVHDRNGTIDLLESLKYTTSDFELVIKSQSLLDESITRRVNDNRIIFDSRPTKDNKDLYNDFDVMILPRRYGGLCLPMNEALASGLPVIMPNISPNNQILPSKWLIEATKTSSFMAREIIDIYSSNQQDLANKIDYFCKLDKHDLENEKVDAFNIAFDHFSSDVLYPKYERLFTL